MAWPKGITRNAIPAGTRFGRVVVLADPHSYRVHCRCDCGGETLVQRRNLLVGKTVSCGCFGRERRLEAATSHGRWGEQVYWTWHGMHQRCENVRFKGYENYGGRGITVCARWRSFENFLADVGERPSPKHCIDRIDNARGYEPGNVRWATRSQQMRNTRKNRILCVGGESACVTEWAERLGLTVQTIRSRLDRGWSIERALTAHTLPRPGPRVATPPR